MEESTRAASPRGDRNCERSHVVDAVPRAASLPTGTRAGCVWAETVSKRDSESTAAGDLEAEEPSGPVKLIVWDLDETLWTGTLSEGPVALAPSRIDVVRALNTRGIVNSICSKNDEADARARLEQAGLWSEFVFARIDWSPKGPRVAQIIEDAQLRPENVLFIDDLPMNRGEVRHYVPGIQTAGPEIIDRLLSLPELSGKDDRELSRLRHYRLLERKLTGRRTAAESNEAFLRSCDIRIGMFHDTDAEVERLFELVNRTHQLNFTKRRPGLDEFTSLLGDPRYETGYVRVRDRYGDYGICGFYSVSLDNGALTDLLFSCRVLHMGVEQWVYDRLGRPKVSVVGEVASSLDGSVEWITLDGEAFAASGTASNGQIRETTATQLQPRRVHMVGGCDLNTTAQFLGGEISTEFSHPGPTGAFVYVGHTEVLRQAASGLTADQRALIGRIPFLDPEVYDSPAVVAPDYDVLVHSVLTDYTQGLYRHRELGLVVPWRQFHQDVTDPANWPFLESTLAHVGIGQHFLRWFSEEFEHLGGITVDRFQENIRWLAGSVPDGAAVIFINGAEVPIDNPTEPERHLHHQNMNAALDQVVAELANATVCDVRTFVLTEDDLTDSIRHYRRRAYARMAEEIRATGASELQFQRERLTARTYSEARKVAARQLLRLQKLSKRWRQAHSQTST